MKKILSQNFKLKIIASAVVFIAAGMTIFAQTDKKFVIGDLPVYKVAKAKEPITVDGKMDEAAWKNAEVQQLTHFFRLDKPVDKQNTKFRMMWDDANIYLFYESEDTSLTARETKFDGRTYIDDCAEFFVVPIPDSVYMHFGFEINITEVRFDYIVLWKYYNNRTFFINGYNPEYQVKAIYNGTLNNDKDKDKGWTMEFAIPMTAFTNMNGVVRAKAGARWAFQAVRQDRNLVDDRFRSTALLYPVFNLKLDVHQPEHFGLMEFTEN